MKGVRRFILVAAIALTSTAACAGPSRSLSLASADATQFATEQQQEPQRADVPKRAATNPCPANPNQDAGDRRTAYSNLSATAKVRADRSAHHLRAASPRYLLVAPQSPEQLKRLLADAGADKLAPLGSYDLLIDCLLQAVHARLRHAELHLILPILPLRSL
jgi:hypothetical protein